MRPTMIASCGILLISTSCSFLSSEATPVTGCPPLREWPSATQERIARDLDTLPPDSPIHAAVIDYARMRAFCKVQ